MCVESWPRSSVEGTMTLVSSRRLIIRARHDLDRCEIPIETLCLHSETSGDNVFLAGRDTVGNFARLQPRHDHAINQCIGLAFFQRSLAFRCIVGALEQVHAELRARPHMYIHARTSMCLYTYMYIHIYRHIYIFRRRMSQMESGKLVSIGIRLIMVPHRCCMNS